MLVPVLTGKSAVMQSVMSREVAGFSEKIFGSQTKLKERDVNRLKRCSLHIKLQTTSNVMVNMQQKCCQATNAWDNETGMMLYSIRSRD